MMVYKFDEELERMVYRFEEEPVAKVITEEGKAWYIEQVRIAEDVGNQHYQELLADLANHIYKDKDAK